MATTQTMARTLIAAAVMLAAVFAGANAHAQAWKPEKAVEIVIGTSPGGPQDRMGRALQRILQERKLVEVPLNVVNKAGGGGAIGLAYLNQHAGDGRYLMVVATTMLANRITGKSAIGPEDLTPIAIMGVEYVSVTVRAESPLKSGMDLVERLRKDPASLSIAIGTALGNATHISLALALKAAGVDIRKLKTVVFNSGAESMTAALGGHVDVAASAPSSVLSQVQTGKMRMLAIGAPRRAGGELANVPTWKELGIDSASDLWRGLAGPKDMSRAQVQYWDDALATVVKSEDWQKELANNRVENVYKPSAETAKYWKAEYDEVRAVLVEMGLAK